MIVVTVKGIEFGEDELGKYMIVRTEKNGLIILELATGRMAK